MPGGGSVVAAAGGFEHFGEVAVCVGLELCRMRPLEERQRRPRESLGGGVVSSVGADKCGYLPLARLFIARVEAPSPRPPERRRSRSTDARCGP